MHSSEIFCAEYSGWINAPDKSPINLWDDQNWGNCRRMPEPMPTRPVRVHLSFQWLEESLLRYWDFKDMLAHFFVLCVQIYLHSNERRIYEAWCSHDAAMPRSYLYFLSEFMDFSLSRIKKHPEETYKTQDQSTKIIPYSRTWSAKRVTLKETQTFRTKPLITSQVLRTNIALFLRLKPPLTFYLRCHT